jgi:hypothetical protein
MTDAVHTRACTGMKKRSLLRNHPKSDICLYELFWSQRPRKSPPAVTPWSSETPYILGGGVHTGSTRHCSHSWPIVPAPGDCEDGEVDGMNSFGRGSRSTWRKPVPTSLCPPQIPISRPGKPATSRFSCGTAFRAYLVIYNLPHK